MGKFSERYKTLKTAELLLILERPEDYQPEAVIDAKAELETRDVTEADKEAAELLVTEAEEEEQQEQEQEEKWQQGQISLLRKLMNLMYPIYQVSPTTHIMIGIILIMGSIEAMKIIWYDSLFVYESLELATKEGFAEWDFVLYMILGVLYNMILPIGVLLLWFRKCLGWSLIVFTMIQVIFGYVVSRYMENIHVSWQCLVKPEPTLWQTIWSIFFGLAYPVIMLALLLNVNVRHAYNITRKWMSITLGLIFLFLLAGFLIGFYYNLIKGYI